MANIARWGIWLSSRIREPLWAKDTLGKISVVRLIPYEEPPEQPITFQFVGRGGWETEAGTVHSAEYIGWRATGVFRGDGDAWLCIWQRPDGSIGYDIYGVGLKVTHEGEALSPRSGPYLYSYRS